MSQELSFSDLLAAVKSSAAAFRSVTRLQPVGGQGDKTFPAPYANGVYQTERRALGDRTVECVLLDSVQSQANRAEDSLKTSAEAGRISLPIIEVDFSNANGSLCSPIPNLTSLDVPHRLADAILRDSMLENGTRFSKSQYAEEWGRSNLWNATPVYKLCPTALVFGMWGSPEKPGGLGAKFERAFVSEIIAVDVVSNGNGLNDGQNKNTRNLRMGFRIDPLNSSKDVAVKQNDDGSFEVGTGKVRPSEINHGNIPFETPNSGIRFAYAEQTTVVSLGALRKLRFPIDGKDAAEINNHARAALAALALCAGVLASESGTSLRSRCDLWPVAEREWEVLERPGQDPRRFRINGEQAEVLLKNAVESAEKAGISWNKQKITLKPSPELIKLVQQSQEQQAKDKGEGAAV